jgi:hypothetical protein
MTEHTVHAQELNWLQNNTTFHLLDGKIYVATV